MNELPRHMTFRPDTLESCFERAFKTADVRQEVRLDTQRWFAHMGSVPVENRDVEDFFRREQLTEALDVQFVRFI